MNKRRLVANIMRRFDVNNLDTSNHSYEFIMLYRKHVKKTIEEELNKEVKTNETTPTNERRKN